LPRGFGAIEGSCYWLKFSLPEREDGAFFRGNDAEGAATLELRREYGYETGKRNDMTKPKPSLQDAFLHHLCENKGASTVFLINGVKLQGVVTMFDDTSLLLRREAHEQLVYKHAISTIMPHDKINLFKGDEFKDSPGEPEDADQ
jgi:host factor-I protein